MRAVWVAALVLLAGCTAGPHPPTSETPQPGVFRATGNGLEPAGQVPGITGPSEDRTISIDFMTLIQKDQVALVLVQALEDQDFDSEQHYNIEVQGLTLPGEGRGTTDFCMLQFVDLAPPLPFYLDRAAGRASSTPDLPFQDRRVAWSTFGAPTFPAVSYGFNVGGKVSGTLNASQSVLFAAGQSGLEELDFHKPGNTWTLDLSMGGKARVILLPPAVFLCGVGFGRFQGVQAVSPFYYSGGDLPMQGLYGTTAAFHAFALTDQGPDPTSVTNAASMDWRGAQKPLDELSWVWRNTYEPFPAALHDERWVGSPSWLMSGISLPYSDEIGLDNGNLTSGS